MYFYYTCNVQTQIFNIFKRLKRNSAFMKNNTLFMIFEKELKVKCWMKVKILHYLFSILFEVVVV